MTVPDRPAAAIVLPPREGFGPRRARGIGLTVRHHALFAPGFQNVVLGGPQDGPVFLDVTFRLARSPILLPGSALFRYTAALVPRLRAIRPAVIEVHEAPRIAVWLQRLFPTVPVVLVLHDEPAVQTVLGTARQRARMFAGLAGVVTISAWLRDRLVERGLGAEQTSYVVPPCIDLAGLPGAQRASEARDLPVAQRRARLVLFAGRLAPEKGVEQFVAACTAALPTLQGWRAEIIGAADHRTRAPETPFVRLIQGIAGPAGIPMLGYRDHPDLMTALSRAAILVIPSLAPEPGGRLALEAMANGAVVICQGTGGLREIAGKTAVYADPSDPAALAAAIKGLAESSAGMNALAERARERAALFDARVVGRWLETVRRKIIAEWDRALADDPAGIVPAEP